MMRFVCDPLASTAMAADAAPAEQFGPYLVYERLGIGGMATVHRALERGAQGGYERFIALKRLLPHLAEDASFIKAFVREARLASLLDHANIVQIFKLGRVGTAYFISMEHIEGRDIRRILRHARRVTGPPPIHVTVGILLQLCDALDYAHTRVDEHGHPLGLIHRDVSPSNLLITRAGLLKVIDFGIAKAQSSQLRTQTGRVKGKLAYMAPEAVAGKELDSRSDLFAVGVIAHELLTARPLFASKNEYQTLLKVQRGDIMPPSTFNQICPEELDALVLRALARDPDERFTTAAELREELHQLCRRYSLQIGHRDIAQWLEWAFSIELPSGSFSAVSTLDRTSSDHGPFDAQTAPARPRARLSPSRGDDDDDEAAVELAWGEHEHAEPVVLDDVPDVSDKHRPVQLAQDLDDLDDDIPPTQPSHGLLPRSRGAGGALIEHTLVPPVRHTMPGHGFEPRPPSSKDPFPLRAIAIETGPAARASSAAEPAPQLARAPSGTISPGQEVPAIALETMRNLPPLPSSARVRAGSVAPRDLPSLEPFLGPELPADEAETVVGLTPEAGLLATERRHRRPITSSKVVIGSAIAARRSRRPPRHTWLVLVALLAAGAGAAAVAVFASRGGEQPRHAVVEAPPPEQQQQPAPPTVPARTIGTVKFATVPEDAEISIEGHAVHHGSPWAIELAPGVHQISIQRAGYKAWLTSLELSANETQLLRVVLESLGGAPAPQEAMLILSTTPEGLDVVLDGQPLPQRTPLRMSIRPGRHTISVRQSGAEVWRQEIDAQPSVDYEFTPSMTADKQRERAERASSTPSRIAGARPAIVGVDRPAAPGKLDEPAGAADRAVDRTIDSPSLPSISTITPEPALPPAPKGPVLIAPTAVTRTGGPTPTLNKAQSDEVPPIIAAKLCIDTAGRVTSVDVLTKLERATASELTSALEEWTYTPYRRGGTAVPACFVVRFRAQ